MRACDDDELRPSGQHFSGRCTGVEIGTCLRTWRFRRLMIFTIPLCDGIQPIFLYVAYEVGNCTKHQFSVAIPQNGTFILFERFRANYDYQ